MVLEARRIMPREPKNMFARMALWEAAVVGYGRVFKSGRRQVPAVDLIDELGTDSRRIHERIIFWRDKHVAHRVTAVTQDIEIRAVLSANERSMDGVSVRVVSHEPDDFDENLANEFLAHVEQVRLRVWEGRMNQLELKLLGEFKDDIASLREGAQYRAHPLKGLVVDINLAEADKKNSEKRDVSTRLRPNNP